MSDEDAGFYDRADAHIALSNTQLTDAIGRGKVSASNLYGVARFNAWVIACSCENAQEMSVDKDKAIEYFVEQYKKMLTDNVDDYIKNFNKYMGSSEIGD